MGLFGGFKAKFTRNSKSKNNTQPVVCTKYHVFSEFDAPSNSNGVSSHPAIVKISANRQQPIRSKRPIIKSEIIEDTVSFEPIKKNHSLQNITTTRPKINTPPVPKSRPPILMHNDYEEPSDDDSIKITTSFELPSNSNSVTFSQTKVDKNHKIQLNGEVEETTEVTMVNALYSPGSEYSVYDQKTRSFKPFVTHNDYEDMSPGNEPSTLIFMTQHSASSDTSYKYPHSVQNKPDYAYDEKIMYIPDQQAYDSTHDDEFKINIVKHNTRNYSISEDEISNLDIAEDSYDDSRLGYSSQASSIFFGGDMNPPVVRKRVIALKNDDDDDEEDC